MLTFLEKVTVVCFAASYGVAFGLELWHLFRPRHIQRILALGFGAAGLLAHIIYMAGQSPPLGSQTGSLFLLALILAVFYVGESIHHARVAWALFVLPVVLGLIGLAVVMPGQSEATPPALRSFWGWTHGALLILAAVGVSVGFIASVMYLVQMRRLHAKVAPGQGLPLDNLERLELMNRRAILGAFPLLTAGLLAGFALQLYNGFSLQDWLNPRILSILGLWGVFAILLYLRYRVHVRGRQLALLTMLAFAILMFALISPPHSFVPGGGP
jgi:ABC-type uncharacterized transport system permease subunit